MELVTDDGPVMGTDLFRSVLRRQAASVVVVTGATYPPVGFTATSFTSVSLSPPLVSFCVDLGSSSWRSLQHTTYVGVHLLAEGQEDLARRFATRGADRFAEPTRWRLGPYGVPLLAEVPAWLIGRIEDRMLAGDHAIVVVSPLLGDHPDGGRRPLVYHMGHYLSVPHPMTPGPDPSGEGIS
jgi:flavin reductase (DIM6/NTAB) family NADH-FMN oxidoreductase RutF